MSIEAAELLEPGPASTRQKQPRYFPARVNRLSSCVGLCEGAWGNFQASQVVQTSDGQKKRKRSKSQTHGRCLFKESALDWISNQLFFRRVDSLSSGLSESRDGLRGQVRQLKYFFSKLICPQWEPARTVQLRPPACLLARASLLQSGTGSQTNISAVARDDLFSAGARDWRVS